MAEIVDPVEEYVKKGIAVTREKLEEQTAKAMKELGGTYHKVSDLSPEIPRRLLKQEFFSGMVVPYTVSRMPEGKPIFGIVDEMRRWECADKELCGICGESLTYWKYFLGGPRSCITAMFIDPPMHEECVVYSLTICPYLKYAPGENAATKAENVDKVVERQRVKYKENEIHSFDIVQEGRPPFMGVYVTRGYKWGYLRRSVLDRKNFVFMARQQARIEWYEGVKG